MRIYHDKRRNREVYYIAATQRRSRKARLARCATPKTNLRKNFCGQNPLNGALNQSNRDLKQKNQRPQWMRHRNHSDAISTTPILSDTIVPIASRNRPLLDIAARHGIESSMNRRRWILAAICAALLAGNAWIIVQRYEEPEPEFALLFDLPYPNECWRIDPPTYIAFERPITFDIAANQWVEATGRPVDIAARLERPIPGQSDWEYLNVRVRLEDSATIDDAIAAFASLADQGVCRSDWAEYDLRVHRYGENGLQQVAGRFDLPLLLREFRTSDDQTLLCSEGTRPLVKPDVLKASSAHRLIPQARAIDIPPAYCLLPDLPQE